MKPDRRVMDLMYYIQRATEELRNLEHEGLSVQVIIAAEEGDQLISSAMAFDKDLTGIIVAVNTDGKEEIRLEFDPNELS